MQLSPAAVDSCVVSCLHRMNTLEVLAALGVLSSLSRAGTLHCGLKHCLQNPNGLEQQVNERFALYFIAKKINTNRISPS